MDFSFLAVPYREQLIENSQYTRQNPCILRALVRKLRKVQENNDFFLNQGLTRVALPSFFRRSLRN